MVQRVALAEKLDDRGGASADSVHMYCTCNMHMSQCVHCLNVHHCWARVQVFVFWRAARAHRRASRSEAAALRDALRFVAAARSPPRDPSTHHHAVCRPQRTRMRCERSSR